MAIVKQYHPASNTTYVYESFSFWDPEKKQSRAKRRLIGKLDPDTGEIVPTGKPGRPKNTSAAAKRSSKDQPSEKSADLDGKDEQILQLRQTIQSLDKKIIDLEAENRQLRAATEKILSLSSQIQSAIKETHL